MVPPPAPLPMMMMSNVDGTDLKTGPQMTQMAQISKTEPQMTQRA
jgi:hypothetical protein